MKTRLYVGNLAYEVTATNLLELFAEYGAADIYIATNAAGSRGFGFLDVDADRAEAAILALDGTQLVGRRLGVAIATARPARLPRSVEPGPAGDRQPR
jgi:RNA recognition motif-containing protein